ncbi:MAG: 4Fe-4S single cluster domain of Ferredoxin [Solirubrobacteraceae bacterium]|jgi:ferredoxin|nr:4Fe-4S single cluster domain of Ferredoxin [Solirubrobacteraceae bacterium]
MSEGPGGRRLVAVDPSACVGSGTCTNIAPGVFRIDERAGVAVVVSQDGAPVADVEEAIAICPVEAIGYVADEPPSPQGVR